MLHETQHNPGNTGSYAGRLSLFMLLFIDGTDACRTVAVCLKKCVAVCSAFFCNPKIPDL